TPCPARGTRRSSACSAPRRCAAAPAPAEAARVRAGRAGSARLRRPRTYPRRMPLRRALQGVEPYRPQPPMRRLQSELGLDHIVKLASNEGPFGPLPAAVAAFEAA